MCNCGCGGEKATRQRFTPDGRLQYSYDDGETWVNVPNEDPRNTSAEFPPIPGEDGAAKKCDAAASAAKVIEDDIIEKMKQSNLGITLVAVIAAVLALYLSGGALAPLVTAVVGAALQAGAAAIEAAFTPTVWDTFKCILYCAMEDDGSFTDAGWQEVKTQTMLQLTGVAAKLLEGTVNAFGMVGMTNAARSGRATGTGCEACGCDETWCFKWDFTLTNGGWTADSEVDAQWVSGQGWKTDSDIGVMLIHKTIPTTATITRMIARCSNPATNGGTGLRSPMPTLNSSAGSTTGDWFILYTGDELCVGFDSNFGSGTNPAYSGAITEVQAFGTGTNPFGSDNCE